MKPVLGTMVVAVVFASAADIEAGPLSRWRSGRMSNGRFESSRVVRQRQATPGPTSIDRSRVRSQRTRVSLVKDTRLTTEDTHVCRTYGPMQVEPGLYVYYAITCPSGTPVAYYSQSPNLATGGSCEDLDHAACEEIGAGGRATLDDAILRLLHQKKR